MPIQAVMDLKRSGKAKQSMPTSRKSQQRESGKINDHHGVTNTKLGANLSAWLSVSRKKSAVTH
jgi:hypothetical protein